MPDVPHKYRCKLKDKLADSDGEGIKRSGGKAPLIINLGARWRSVVKFTALSALLSVKNSGTD